MTASRRFFCLTVVAFLSTLVVSQALPKYDPATETTFKGVVQELKLVPPSGGKPVVYLVLKSNPEPAQVFL